MVKTLRAAFVRNILLIVAVVAFAFLLVANREDLGETWQLLKNVDLRLALLLPVVQIVSYYFISGYYRSFIHSFGGINLARWRAFGTTMALNFVNQILPSGGASGTTYMIYAFKDAATPGQLTLIQLGRYIIASLAYVPLLAASWLWLYSQNLLNPQLTTVLVVVGIISLPGTILLIIGLRNQRLVDAIVRGALGFINWVARTVFRRKRQLVKVSLSHGFLKEFHDGMAFIRERGTRVIKPIIYMQLSTLAEILIVWLAFWIVGINIDPAIIVIGFTAANIAGAISIVPGDVGVHELAIITVLSYVGISQDSAIAGTLMYRVFNKVLIMALGFVFYVKFLKPIVKNVKSAA